MSDVRRAFAKTAEPFGWHGLQALLAYFGPPVVLLLIQFGLGLGALRSVGIALAVPISFFVLLFLWNWLGGVPRDRAKRAEKALGDIAEANAEGVAALNSQLEKASQLRERIDFYAHQYDHTLFDVDIKDWIEDTAGVLDRFARADTAGFRADTGQYDKSFDWTIGGYVDSQVERKNRRLQRLDRHVERLTGIIARLRSTPQPEQPAPD